MKFLALVGTLLCLTLSPVFAAKQPAVTNLPDISVIGNFLGTVSDSTKSFEVNEVEFAFQHRLYPDVRADIFAALHKEDGSFKIDLEEAYVTFSDAWGTLAPDSDWEPGIGVVLGKKLVGIGKENTRHPEQRYFVDRPLATKQVFGDEGLSGEGGMITSLLPLPFFSQLELGLWTASTHEETGTHSGVEYAGQLFTVRWWNGFELSDSQELELGISNVAGNINSANLVEHPNVLALDATWTSELNSTQSVRVFSELYAAHYGEDGGAHRFNQSGGFIGGVYTLSKHYNVGLRYGFLGKHGDEGNAQNQWSVMGTRQLTDTSKLRLQYSAGQNVESTILFQFIFGMGPHSHVLQ